MIKKFTSGNPIDTQAVVEKFNALPIAEFPLGGKFENGNFVFEFDMADSDIVYGLGEAPRGINKRGWVYNSFCSDDPFHTETKSSLYAAHNFLMLSGSKTFGIFIDFPSKIRWDIGYTTANKTVITIDGTDFDIYYIDGTKPLEIVKEFRKSIGTSYVPPFWAFGYQQSRWSYHNAEAVDAVVDGYNKAGIPLDCVYLDIDYMERYKDFTVDDEKFPNFKDYVSKKREEGIHLIPIIDAGVKKENGYDIYEEGRKNGYFCKNEDGTDFEGGVWPGIVGFPDFLRPDVRKWFGSKYKILTDMGIDGFWNDMNEPAIFYSVKGLNKALDKAASLKGQNLDLSKFFELKDTFAGLSNSPEDYSSIYHTVDGKQVCHDQVHNIYGANMTKAAGEYFAEEFGKEKILMFSRASYVGAVQAVSGSAITTLGGHTFFLTSKCSRQRICAAFFTAVQISEALTKTQPVTLFFVSLHSVCLLRLCVTMPLSAQEIRSATALKTAMISRILLRFVTDLFRTFTEHSKRQAKKTI